jgi:hypothetical protein
MMSTVEAAASSVSARRAGIVLIAATVLSVVAMAHHPSIASHDAAEAVAEVGRKADLSRLVHGVLIALMALDVYAFSVFCERLGFGRDAVRLGFVAFAIGTGAMISAATISGFVVSALAAHYASPDADASRFVDAASLAMAGNRALTNLGAIAFSGAILAWSIALWRDPVRRWLAIVGFAAALLPAIALLGGFVRLDVTGMTLVVVAEAVWYVLAGIALIRGNV